MDLYNNWTNLIFRIIVKKINVVVVAIDNTQKSRLILVNMEIGCKDPLANR